MADYLVSWTINIEDVSSPLAAAVEAWETMRDEDSIANVFVVTAPDGTTHEIDLAGVDWQ